MSSVAIVPDPQPVPPLPAPTWADLLGSVPSPKSLVAHLDRHVVGQQAAKRKLAVAVSNHFRRLADGERWGGRVAGPDPLADAPDLAPVVVERSNVLLIGPSGSRQDAPGERPGRDDRTSRSSSAMPRRSRRPATSGPTWRAC